MDRTNLPRLVLALKGYFILRRTWRCAWAMAARLPTEAAHHPVPRLASLDSSGRRG